MEVPADADHREVERRLVAEGWTLLGRGDWATGYRSPDGAWVARVSPFDPVGPYTAELYRRGSATGRLPRIAEHHRLVGGGDLQVVEHLESVPTELAETEFEALGRRQPGYAEVADLIAEVHARASRELPWCGPLDDGDVGRAADGRLVLYDLFYADGPNLYACAATDPDHFVTTIPEPERRFLTEIPIAASGGWQPGEQERLRLLLAAADARV